MKVAGFAVDAGQLGEDRLEGLPVVAFDTLGDQFPAASHDLLIAVDPHGMNSPHAERFAQGKAMGYRFASCIASGALLWPDLAVGEGCMIFEGAVVELISRIGRNSVLRAGMSDDSGRASTMDRAA